MEQIIKKMLKENTTLDGTIKKIPWNKRKDVWDKSEEIIRLYQEELMNTKEIAKMMRCENSLIKKMLKENNVVAGISERRKILNKAGKLKVWNKDLTIEDERVVNNIKGLKRNSDFRKNKTYEEIYGEEKAKEIQLNQSKSGSISKIGEKNPMFRKKQTDNWMEMRRNLVLPLKNTSIELKIQNYLKDLGIEFFTHQYIKEIEHGYQCDIIVPSRNLIIECDGDYWHANPIFYPNPTDRQQLQISKDRIRTTELIAKGFKVLRLWEHEIRSMEIGHLQTKMKFAQLN